MAAPTYPPTERGLSRVSYLPGLDGLRAIAVIAVMLYHADHDWLPGGYLGVEVFFVISGYLITLLLIGEHERNGHVDLRQFWMRRFRRLLPALFVMMAAVMVYVTAFFPAARGQSRGDFLGGALYVSNWYQIFVGQGYAAGEAFVPLRHLWSLAVEEQFYLLWPLVMVVILARAGRSGRRLPMTGFRLILVSVGIAVVTAVLFVSGPLPLACSDEVSKGYWRAFGRCISVNDTLYLSSVTRAGGLMLGAGFAMLWRPAAVSRGPLRDKARRLDILAVLAIAALVVLFRVMFLFESGAYNGWLFRGGLLVVGVLTLLVIAAVSHQFAAIGPLLGNPVLRWIGTRSYGLYLFHWPIYQAIRKEAQIGLSLTEWVVAMALTALVTEASYRFVEMPIRRGELAGIVRRATRSRQAVVASCAVTAMLGVGLFSLWSAEEQCVGAVQCSLAANTTAATGEPETSTPANVTTIPPTTTTFAPQPYVAVGESVMVGAVTQLGGSGIWVDAKENRGVEGVTNAIRKLDESGVIGIGTNLVVQTGTNWYLSDAELDTLIAAIPDGVSSVRLMTVYADVEWIAGNNDLIRGVANRYPGVGVIDWAAAAGDIELCPDGIHITCGEVAPVQYANLILGSLGLAELPVPSTTTTAAPETTVAG
ncbi:MAG: hypothetical protein RLZ04_1540 [Actinomycetota bacterium]|jgi:peptidoglycan/LPS O-acetylase OafA/YrhL